MVVIRSPDITMLLWIILATIVVGVLALNLGVNYILTRFDIRPQKPEETGTGLHQVIERVESWARRRG
jgi:hypothetical protein